MATGIMAPSTKGTTSLAITRLPANGPGTITAPSREKRRCYLGRGTAERRAYQWDDLFQPNADETCATTDAAGSACSESET